MFFTSKISCLCFRSTGNITMRGRWLNTWWKGFRLLCVALNTRRRTETISASRTATWKHRWNIKIKLWQKNSKYNQDVKCLTINKRNIEIWNVKCLNINRLKILLNLPGPTLHREDHKCQGNSNKAFYN